MKKATVKLLDGTIYTYESQYIWGYKDELNDNRTEFFEIGNLITKKSNILSIEIIDLDKEELKEVETNE